MDYIFLSGTILFQGLTPSEAESMLRCLGVVRKSYEKGQVIFHAGDTIQTMGIVLSGSVNIENDGLWGNRDILSHITAGQIFGETYACIPGEPMMVNAVAAEPSQVLFLDMKRVLTSCPAACPHHSRMIRNLLAATAQKNLNLSRRIMFTSPKTIRGRLLSYLSFLAARQKTTTVTVPFNRQQLADYLSVDRSALSGELGRMRREGLLEVDQNRFTLLEEEKGAYGGIE